MRLKRLEVVGFKSFLERTTFDFTVPITGIVGPNGCGKSNVVDAIKWVTGELSFKELRGRTMEDLIFAGSELRPPTGMAEVILTLDNSTGAAPEQYREYSEISVLRRIFRDGTSEFFINKIPCRLRDIVDIFLDTGVGRSSYSIIEQGRIGMIVASKPEDRRLMIEEAAGISKYKNRKEAAHRKMEYTRQNLLRLNDVLGEIRRQIQSLERQARKAEKYREVRDRARALDLSLSARMYAEHRSRSEALAKSERDAELRVGQEGTELTVLEAKLEESRLSLLEEERRLEEALQIQAAEAARLQEKTTSLEGMHRESELFQREAELHRVRSETAKSDADAKRTDIESRLLSLEEKQHEHAQLVHEFSELDRIEKALEEEISTTDADVNQLRDELMTWVAKSAELRNDRIRCANKIEGIERDCERRRNELESISAEIRQLSESIEKQRHEKGRVEQLRFGFQREQGDTRRRLDQLRADAVTLRAELSDLDREMEGERARLSILEELKRTYSEYGAGARAVMEAKGANDSRLSGVCGLLGEMIHAHRGYERALEAVLSERLKGFVVGNARDAESTLAFLKAEGKGRGACLSPRVRSSASREWKDIPEGVEGRLSDFVTAGEMAKEAVSALLGHVYVVDTLDRAITLWDRGDVLAAVTRDGDGIAPDGVLFGGVWVEEERGILQRQGEMESLRESLEEGRTRRVELEARLKLLDREVPLLEGELNRIGLALSAEDKNAFEREKDVGRLQEAFDRTTYHLQVVQKELLQLEAEKSEEAARAVQTDADLTVAQEKNRQVESVLEERVNVLASLRESRALSEDKTRTFQIRMAALAEQCESCRRELAAFESDVARLSEEGIRSDAAAAESFERSRVLEEAWRIAREEQAKEIVELERRRAELEVERIAHAQVRAGTQDAEAAIKELRGRISAMSEELHEMKMALREETMRAEHIDRQIREKYNVSIEFAQSAEGFAKLADEAVKESEAELETLREKMLKIGEVNLASIEELKELSEREQFLTQQRDDLEKALDSLSQAIRKINSTTKDLFASTFEAINSQFQEVFPRLFRGGKAKLILTDPENLLETGVEIMAQPPGKKLQNMNLLSGGEKALVAIALLFAIFQHKAPPFCLLDEVDAPLDDANILRFLSLVEEMSRQTQFIMITHNKASMEGASHLYGVTMEEPGVSRMVSVRLSHEAAAAAATENRALGSGIG